MKPTIAPPTAEAKQAFLDALEAGLSPRDAAARTATTFRSFKLERRRAHVDRLIDVAVAHLTTGERARLAARIKHWAEERAA